MYVYFRLEYCSKVNDPALVICRYPVPVRNVNPFSASCSKLLLCEGYSAILVFFNSTKPIIFTAQAYARAVLGVVFLSVRVSVRPSVCLSYAWIVTNLNDALQIFWYHTKGQSLCYSNTNSGWWAMLPSIWNLRSKWPTPFEKRQLRQISAHNVWTVRDSGKKFRCDEYKVEHALSNDL